MPQNRWKYPGGSVTIKLYEPFPAGESLLLKLEDKTMDYNKAALEMHETHKGKVGIVSKVEVATRDDLSTAYTPGVAEPCRKIKENPEDVSALPLSKADIEPTEAKIQTQIDTLLNQYATTQNITDRAAQSGDTVNIDYSGAVDGVAFTGGTATGYDLTLGSHAFIDGFEDQIIGHNIGDTFDVTVTFPEGYGDSTDAEGNTITLSGKEAVFSVTLNAITQSVVPTLTDEWVETNFAASDDLHTADALRQYFDSALYANNLDNAAMDYLLTNSTFKEVPTQITSYYIRMFLNYHSQLATQYGMELDAYAQAKGYADADAMLADSDAYFEHLAKQDLVFQAIAEQLDITPTQEQIDSANSSYADTYGAQRSMLNALQLAVLDKVEESAVLS